MASLDSVQIFFSSKYAIFFFLFEWYCDISLDYDMWRLSGSSLSMQAL
jgi:hypothetical protein